MFEIMVLSPQRERPSLRFDEGLTVRATESRRHGRSKLPDLEVNTEVLSTQAAALYLLLAGDDSQVRYLASSLASVIENDPAFMSWKLKGRAYEFAQIVIYDFAERPKSPRFAAQLMGISVRSYRTSWMQTDKFNLVKYYLNCWKDQIKRLKT